MKITPATEVLSRHAPRASVRVLLASLVVALSACTTSVVQHSPDTRPVTRNSSPSSMSELRIAQTALDSGNVELATTLFNRVLEHNPDSVEALTGLGNTLYAVGDDTRAGVYYAKASKLDAQSLAPLIGLGRVAIHQRRFDDAVQVYQSVLARTPNDPIAASGLAVAMDLKGDHAGAQSVLRSALVANPGDPMLSINLGLSLVLGGNPREGANVLLDVTRYPDAPPQARQDLALAYGMLGNIDAATEILSKDLPKASIDDNLRYYAMQRNAIRQPASSATPARASQTLSARSAALP